MNPLRVLDRFIDDTTTYRLMLYYLIGLLLGALGLSLMGNLSFGPLSLVLSVAVLLVTCWASNRLFGWVFRVPVGNESSLITALILSLLITPQLNWHYILFAIVSGFIAMASKYVLAINRKHIFNPAAIAVLLMALGPMQTASWWVGSGVMLPLVIIGGLILIRKEPQGWLLLLFFVYVIAVSLAWALPNQPNVLHLIQRTITSTPMFFLGFVMLTEPLTAPSTRVMQIIYAGIVGALLPPQAHILGYYTSPELALVIGNAFAYVVSPKVRSFLTLKNKVLTAKRTMDFVFTPARKFNYLPGQYMEFTLPHASSDSRGNRRYFTLASSPTEADIHLGVKFYNPSSSYKKAMLKMTAKTPYVAARLAGDFTLPKNKAKKLAFIAGGIGVTPFRSMTKYMTDTTEHRDIVMLYGARTLQDVAYREVFEAARTANGMRTMYVLSGEQPAAQIPNTYIGTQITADVIGQAVPDYQDRIFYVSGTHQMVVDTKRTLRHLGVRPWRIKTDYFPGYTA